MDENEKLGFLIILAKSGDQVSMQLIIERLKPLTKKLSRRVQDVGLQEQIEQELIEEIIKIVKRFEPKYIKPEDDSRGDSTK